MARAARIPVAIKAAYGSGQIAEGLKSTCFGLFVMFYYNQLLGLSGSLAGLAVMIALIFDAVTDPLTGTISDRWKSTWGRRHPFMYASIVPLGISFFLLFSPPAGLGQTGLFLWLTAFAMLARGSITLFYVPHTALGAELTDDFGERTSVVQWRQGMAIWGGLFAVGVGFLGFFPNETSHRNPDLYPMFAAVISLMMMAAILGSALGTHRQIPTLLQPATDGKPLTLRTLWEDAADALSNRSFRWFFIGVIIIFLMVGVDSALGLYMNTYFWQITGKPLFLLSIAFPVGSLVGAFFTRYFHQKFDKRPVVMAGTACWALCQIVPVTLFLIGAFPEAGSGELLAALFIIRVVQGFGTVQALVSAGSMIADIADEHELRTKKRSEGVFFGALSFSGKCTTGLGNFVAGVALDLIAWPTGRHVTVGDIPPETIVKLGLMYGPMISLFAVAAIYCYAKYSLSREEHARILEALGRSGPQPPLPPQGEVPATAPAYAGAPAAPAGD